ncbi:MAG: hypothetical protein WBA23_21530 [Tunicatimonas sp.]
MTLYLLTVTWGCHSNEEVAPSKPVHPPLHVEPPLTDFNASLPPPEVTRTEYPGAIRLEVTLDVHGISSWNRRYKKFFGVANESFQSKNEINASAENTNHADMYFEYYGIGSTDYEYTHSLDFPESAPTTLFKEVKVRPAIIEYMATTAPELLQSKFEDSPAVENNFVGNYEYTTPGSTYVFKTDRSPARYGLIKILESDGGYTGPDGFFFKVKLEIVFQK